MKSRLSFFLISGIIILAILIGVFTWHSKHINQISRFKETSFNTPISSKYIPSNTDIIFHWKISPNILPNNFDNFHNKVNKNILSNQIRFIRDTFFQLMSLDFVNDISKWVGDYGSFALIESNKQFENDWIMVLEIKDNDNIEEEFESFSNERIIDDTINSGNKSSSSKIKIISKKINSNNSIYLAKNQENILIASNPKIIDTSIKQFYNHSTNTKKKYKKLQLKENIDDGLFLLEISPKKIFNSIGQKDKLFELDEAESLISSINIDHKKLNLEGIIYYGTKTKMPSKMLYDNLINAKEDIGLSEDYILIDNPKQYFGENINHPYQKFIATMIRESTTSDFSKLFKSILENSNGNLTWINDKDWSVLTSKYETEKQEIINDLENEKFSKSNLEFQNKDLEVWSKISTNNNERNELKQIIGAIIEEDQSSYLWSKNLISNSSLKNINYSTNNIDAEYKIDIIEDFDDVVRIHLGKEKTEALLNNFYPYILFKTMLGNRLNPLPNIDISIAVPRINYPDFIKFKINFKTS